MSVEYEPFSPRWRADPYPTYRALRDGDPVHWAPESKTWCVSRYEDVLTVLRHPELFSSRAMFTVLMNGGMDERPPLSWNLVRFVVLYALRTRLSPLGFARARILIAADPPVHGPLRSMVNRGFTPRQIQALEPRIRELVSEQTAPLRAGVGFDVVRDLAIPLPVVIVAEMLGVEPERRADFKRWSDDIIEGMTGAGRADPFAPALVDSFIGLNRYIKRISRERRRNPADDLISTIIAEAPGGESMNTMEVILFVQLLLVAGNETTTNLIGNAVNALLDHPDQLERVCDDPSLVPALVEETLRFDAPVQMVFRKTTREVELAGATIPEGADVAVLLGSANRDERRFEHPDRLDVTRSTVGHLGFGFGQHFCLGASLARLEALVALEALVPALPRLRRVSPHRELLDSFLVRGAQRLELRPAA